MDAAGKINGVTDIANLDVSSCYITNNIEEFNVKSGADLVMKNTHISNETTVWDPSLSAILKFKRGSTDISCSITSLQTGGLPCSKDDFSFWNENQNPQKILKTVDGFSVHDQSQVKVWIDYSANDHSKIINKNDTVYFYYTPGNNNEAYDPWPTTIKDEFGNYLLDSLGLDVNSVTTSSLDLSGSLTGQPSVSGSGEEAKKIYLDYDIDICANTITHSGFSITTTPSISYPENLTVVSAAVGSDAKKIVLTLNEAIWADSSLNYLNYTPPTTGGTRNTYGVKLNTESSVLIDIGGILIPGGTTKYSFTKNPATETMMGKYDDINLFIDPSLNSSLTQNKAGFEYKVIYKGSYEGNGADDDVFSKNWTSIAASNVSINTLGDIITLNTGYNTGVGVKGFSKQHTYEQGNFKNEIQVKYTKQGDGLLGDTGYMRNIPQGIPLELNDASNNILDISVNIANGGLNASSDISSVMIFNEFPNRIYMRVQQPDLSGSVINSLANTYWHDITNIDLSGVTVNSFGLDYSNNTVASSNLKAVSVVVNGANATAWEGSTLNGEVSTESVVPQLIQATGLTNANWVCLEFDKDFQPVKDGPMQTFDLSYIHMEGPTTLYSTVGDISGIFGQNGGVLKNFSTADVSSNATWADIAFEVAPYIPDTSSNTIVFSATTGSDGFTFNENTRPEDFIYTHSDDTERTCSWVTQLPPGGQIADCSFALTFDSHDLTSNLGTLAYNKRPGYAGLRVGNPNYTMDYNHTQWVKSFSGKAVTSSGGAGFGFNDGNSSWSGVAAGGPEQYDVTFILVWDQSVTNTGNRYAAAAFLNQFTTQGVFDGAPSPMTASEEGDNLRLDWTSVAFTGSVPTQIDLTYERGGDDDYWVVNGSGEFGAEFDAVPLSGGVEFAFDNGNSSFTTNPQGQCFLYCAWDDDVEGATPTQPNTSTSFLAQFVGVAQQGFNGGSPDEAYIDPGFPGLLLLLWYGPGNTGSTDITLSYTRGATSTDHVKNSGGVLAAEFIEELITYASGS